MPEWINPWLPQMPDGVGGMPVPPQQPHWSDTLGSLLTNLGAGIAMASSTGRPWAAGIAPGIAMASQAQAADENRRYQQAMAYQQQQQMAEYRKAQMEALQAKTESERNRGQLGQQLAGILGFNVQPNPVQMGPQGDPASAIAAIESGGKYDALGPVANAQGDRAYGKYQVMGANIGPWTQEILGKAMTPQEFIASPQAQDAVFKAKFGQYRQQYGSDEAASRAWFAGPGGMNNPNARDVNGVSVAQYSQKFQQGMPGQVAQGGGELGGGLPGGGPPNQIAQLDPALRATIATVMQQDPVKGAQMLATALQNVKKDDAWVPLGDADSKMFLGPAYDPTKAYQRNKSTGKIEPIGGSLVNIQNQGENKALQVQIESANKAHTELQDSAKVARTGLSQINRLGGLLDQLNTNKFTSTTTEIKAMAKGLGIDLGALGIKDDVGPAQAADALSKQLALALRDPSAGGGMPGALSNSDREFLARMVPTLDTTVEGRKLMLDYARKMYQRNIEIAKVANDYLRSKEFASDPSGLYAKIQEYADANPLFSEADAAKVPQQAAPATPPGSLPMPQAPAKAPVRIDLQGKRL